MRKTSKVNGTKIAQAAKDLNVTSVTVRRYLSEFSIETATDQNGIKVLPETSMDELKEVRRLKEDGLTNPQVLESLEETRKKGAKTPRKGRTKKVEAATEEDAGEEEEAPTTAKKKSRSRSKTETTTTRKRTRKSSKDEQHEEEEEAPAAPKRKRRSRKKDDEEVEREDGSEDDDAPEQPSSSEGRLKHSLTCQTCGKTFEHLNPRLRDCLDCYRAKRKERRRGGGDRHKNVIQHPLAQQVVNKMETRQQTQTAAPPPAAPVAKPKPQSQPSQAAQPIIGGLKTKVRSYRKAIEETRQITGSLKRRLERPDLPEGDRRWLEQIYAYQLILHQGWRHLSEYRAGSKSQKGD